MDTFNPNSEIEYLLPTLQKKDLGPAGQGPGTLFGTRVIESQC